MTEMPRKESIGERLRRLRLEREMSQRDLSSPGVSYAYISRIEAGARQPSVKALRKLARTLGVSPEYLETGTDLGASEDREMRLAEAELELRLAEDTTKAEAALGALLAEAEEGGDSLLTTRARSALGLAAFRRGSHAEAIAQLEQTIASGHVSPISNPELYATLSRSYVSAGAGDKAVQLLRECTETVEHAGSEHVALYVRFAIYLSYAQSEVGDLQGARDVLTDAIERAEHLTDPYMRVRLFWSRARLAAVQRDPRTALDNLRRAIALLEATEDTRQLGRGHLLWAEILTFEGNAAEARKHLKLAEELLGAHPDAEDQYWLRTEQARCEAELGAGDEAIARAREALKLIGDSDPAERGAAYWALGQGLAVTGDLDEANLALARAVELLRSQRVWHEAAAASRAWAEVLAAAGREDEAAETLEQAAELDARAAMVGTSPGG